MPQCGSEQGAADVGEHPAPVGGRRCGDVGEAAQNLGQDDAGVPPRALQCTASQRGGDLDHVVRRCQSVGLRPCRTHGEQHVCSGVSVRDREHIEAVDLVGVGDEVADGGVRPVPQSGGVEPPIRHAHLQPDVAAPRWLEVSTWAQAYRLELTAPRKHSRLWRPFW